MSADQVVVDQAKLWNGPAGQAWVEAQELLDGMFELFERMLVEPIEEDSGARVLDIGCGTGATTLAAARRVGPRGRAVGIDLSEPMIALARERASRAGSNATFICADAQTYSFEPATVDRFISRFGVMFFEDPVRAFANLRRAATDDARLDLAVFRSPAENPFMTAAERAAAPYLPGLPPRRPDAPGQFAFADRERVGRILEQGGWARIEIDPIDVPCVFPARELERYMTRLGPVGLAMQQVDAATRDEVVAAVRAGFDPFVQGDDVRFTAACWRVCARGAR
jgi:SAM-dependent methyltransferase